MHTTYQVSLVEDMEQRGVGGEDSLAATDGHGHVAKLKVLLC